MKQWYTLCIVILSCMILAACGDKEEKKENNDTSLQKITVMLDWNPNTNHTGLYVARDEGYYQEEGLEVTIMQPGETGVEQAVATGHIDFGVSYQEQVTTARTQGIPIVSIAAVIQHNTSGFASLKEKNITTVNDFEGKTYGGWGSASEKAVIQSVMENAGADYSKLKQLDTGYSDFFTALKKDIDLGWIFYGWDGVQSELIDVPLHMIYVKDLAEELDYYTPVIITNEKKIKDQSELVKKFMKATARGYEVAINDPEKAANILIKAEPELDEALVIASQKWLSGHFQADAARWGEQKLAVWADYGEWMFTHKLLEKPLEAELAFTNEFLPQTK